MLTEQHATTESSAIIKGALWIPKAQRFIFIIALCCCCLRYMLMTFLPSTCTPILHAFALKLAVSDNNIVLC
jgi:hypothetical protein